MHKSSHGSYGIWLVFWVVTVVCFFEIFWTSGVLTVNFRDSIPRPMGCHENMIKIDIRDVSPHHLILLVDSYFSIKVTGNVFFFSVVPAGVSFYYCVLVPECIACWDTTTWTRQIDGSTVPPSIRAVLSSEFFGLLIPWCLFGGIKENAASKWPRKSGFNVNFSYNWANKHQTHHQ